MMLLDLAKFRNSLDIKVYERVIKNNLGVTDEHLLVIGDKGISNDHLLSPILTNAFSVAANNLGISTSTVYQTARGPGENADVVLQKQIKALPPKSTVIVNVSNRMGKMFYLDTSFRKYCVSRQHRFISTSSLAMVDNSKLGAITKAFSCDAWELERRAFQVKKLIDNADEMHISTPGGTDLTVGIKKYPAKIASGVYTEPGTGGNGIPGETYLAPDPKSIHGRFVIDGSVRTLRKTFVVRQPVKCDIKNNDIVAWNHSPESRLLQESIAWAHRKAKNVSNLRKIGEVGIGLNKQASIIGTTIVDEKVANTCHLAIGSNNWFGGDVKAPIHLDQVMKNPTFKIGSKLLKF